MIKGSSSEKQKIIPDVAESELDEDLKTIVEYMFKKEKRTKDAVNLNIYTRKYFDLWNKNADLKEEFVYYIKNKKFPTNPIEVHGWTAEKLLKEHKKIKYLSSSYGLLFSLRQDPKMLDWIARDFPIK